MSDKDVAAQEIVKRYALYAAGAGLIPIPVADFAAITALEVKMLHDLGDMYGVPFSQETVRPIVASLIGGYSATKVGYGVGGSMMKSVPTCCANTAPARSWWMPCSITMKPSIAFLTRTRWSK